MQEANVVLEIIDEVVVSYATEGTLLDADLQRIIEACSSGRTLKYLSIATGVIVVNAKQRAEAKKIIGVRLVAVIDSAMMRGIITALSWFGVKVEAFAPNQLDRAVDSLEVSREQRSRILAAVARMKAGAGVAA